jgi:hypothetical protein
MDKKDEERGQTQCTRSDLARPSSVILGLEYICIGVTASMYTPSDSLV